MFLFIVLDANQLLFFQLPSVLSESVFKLNDKTPQIKQTGEDLKDVKSVEDLKVGIALHFNYNPSIKKCTF